MQLDQMVNNAAGLASPSNVSLSRVMSMPGLLWFSAGFGVDRRGSRITWGVLRPWGDVVKGCVGKVFAPS